ncbi:hypothetical protein Patl1_26192 [Pistacia atlantica]|uniref:Uncharacterized protein n=1 Tax=Pistacia atlantica TaxID=434234 RepID=A0ACC1B154_9ROSI|nr:hypothetical protein Patl1_26192 [Pistacia atlantica]
MDDNLEEVFSFWLILWHEYFSVSRSTNGHNCMIIFVSILISICNAGFYLFIFFVIQH